MLCLREREQAGMVRGAVSASVPNMDEKGQKEFWRDNAE